MELRARKTKIIVIGRKFTNHLPNPGLDCDISNLSVLHIEQKGYEVDKLDIFQIVRAKTNGKALLNEQL